MRILYIAYMDLKRSDSGSGVRPEKMHRAFVEAGHEVKLLCGSQERAHRAARRAAVEEISAWLDERKPDLCYIESPVYPILWGFDRRLIEKIHALHIPIGYFYRDFHRLFPALFPRRTDLKGRMKELWLDWKFRQTNRVLRCADIVYLPSRRAAELFSFPDMRPLPPAGENRLPSEAPPGRTSIYVGGILGVYDGARLLDAFHLLNQEGDYPLILVCRLEEWDKLDHPDKNASWLEVHHVSGRDLEGLYRRAGLGLCLYTANDYCRYAVSVKLYEYMSYGLPAVVSGAPEMEKLVERSGTGLAVSGGPEKVAEAVKRFYNQDRLRRVLRDNVKKTLLGEDLWVHRAQQVVRELQEKTNP